MDVRRTPVDDHFGGLGYSFRSRLLTFFTPPLEICYNIFQFIESSIKSWTPDFSSIHFIR